jgi:hypothetical protein
MAWFVDEQGKVRSDSEIRRALRTDLNTNDLCAYVVVNMGFVTFEFFREALWIRLRPRAVSQATLAGALLWLAECSDSRIVIAHYETMWRHEVFGRTGQVLARLAELAVIPKTLRAGDFCRHRRNTISGELLSLVQLWQCDPALLFSEDCMEFLRDGLGGRYIVLKCAQGLRRLEICAVGRGYVAFDNAWLAQAVGRRFEDQPDYLFACWAAEAYHEAAEEERVIIDDVDVLLDNPSRQKSRLRYQRVILPFRERSGDQLFLSSSRLDGSIDLRTEVD